MPYMPYMPYKPYRSHKPYKLKDNNISINSTIWKKLYVIL